MFPIIINRCFGGYGFSNVALAKYNLVNNEVPGFKPVKYGFTIDREDPIMIEICLELGAQAHKDGSKPKIKYIPNIYRNYFTIHEYDGMESITIHHEKYRIDCIKNICNNQNMTADNKLLEINKILQLELK
jgi:hypothetical protein